jgi:uncharacterized metal-binding protein YceD (DUF177 family)
MTAHEKLGPEFSIVVAFDDIGEEPREFDLSAGDDERSGLAKRFGLVSIASLEAKLVLVWLKPNNVLSVKGRFSGQVTQSCVVTLDPVAADVGNKINVVFARDVAESADLVDPNDAEPLDGEMIDIGELVAEELSLSLDPYPRRHDVDPAAIDLGPGARLMTEEVAEKSVEKNNPFEVLAGLKPKL